MSCCINCFDDYAIIDYINDNGEIGDCDYCYSLNIMVCDLEEIGNLIRDGIARAYEDLNAGSGATWDNEEDEYIGSVKSIMEICQEWSVFSEKVDEKILLNDLINNSGPSDRAIQKGAYTLFDNICDQLALKDYLYGSETTNEYYNWNQFKYMAMYYNRFFDINNEKGNSRESLLGQLADVFQSMEGIISEGVLLFRARKHDDVFDYENVDLLKELGAAPKEKVKQNRMSPRGISYIYLGDDVKTCLEEAMIDENSNSVVGEFMLTEELKILDLSLHPKIKYISIFSGEYEHSKHFIKEFIEEFKYEISKVIKNEDKELEYIPTQILAEYIRKLGYKGIKFESSIRNNTFNYVLFYGAKEKDTYEHSLLNLKKIEPFSTVLKLNTVKFINGIDNINNPTEKQYVYKTEDVEPDNNWSMNLNSSKNYIDYITIDEIEI